MNRSEKIKRGLYAEEALRWLFFMIASRAADFPFLGRLDKEEQERAAAILKHIAGESPTKIDSPVERWIPLHEATRLFQPEQEPTHAN